MDLETLIRLFNENASTRSIQYFTLPLKEYNHLTFKFSNMGASLFSLYYDDEPLILELSDTATFLHSLQYFNKTLGLTAGRIKSEFTYKDVEYHFKDDKKHPGIMLHGGEESSISFKLWKFKLRKYKNRIDVIFTYSPRRNQNGFKGKVTLYNIYSIYLDKPHFRIRQKAKIKEDTFINLSNHIYWNFNRSLTVDDYSLKFDAPYIGKCDDNLLIVDTIKTPDVLSFKKKAKLKSRLDKLEKTSIGTIDNTFLFNEKDKTHSLLLENKEYLLKMKTNYPAMNIYVDSSLTPLSFKNRSDFKARRAIALEPQKYIFDLDSIYYKKGQKYDFYIDYQIKHK